MKRIVALALVCCLCFSLSACGKSKEAKKADELILAIGEVSLSSAQIISDAQSYYEALTDKQKREVENYDVLQEAQYLYARQLLGYDIPGLMFRIIEGGVQTNDKEAIDEAVSILENLGDYKESKELLVKCEVSLKVLDKESNYQKAITLFSEGDFEEARTVFDTLGNDYEDTQKYLAAMTWLDKYIGEWVLKEGYLSATDFDKTVANDLVLTIAPPYAIRSSQFSDCDWCVTANVTLDVEQVVIGGGGSGANFRITGNEILSHSEGKAPDDLSDIALIRNDNLYHTIFNSRLGAYSKIVLSMSGEGENTYIRLSETPYDVSWKTYYNDGGSAILIRKSK